MPMLEQEAKNRSLANLKQNRNTDVEKVPHREDKSAVKAGKIFQVNEKYWRI